MFDKACSSQKHTTKRQRPESRSQRHSRWIKHRTWGVSDAAALAPLDPIRPNYAAQVAALRDQIRLTGSESTTADAAATPIFYQLEFAHDDVMTWDDMLAQGFGIEVTGQDDIVARTPVSDRINRCVGVVRVDKRVCSEILPAMP